METKEILNWIFAFSAIAALSIFIALGWIKESNRAKESDMLLGGFIEGQRGKVSLLTDVLHTLVTRSVIVVFHDGEGRVVIRSVETMDPDIAKRLIEREIAREEQPPAGTAEQAQ